MNIITFRAEHVRAIALQSQQAKTISAMTVQYLKQVELAGPAMSAEVDGKIVASAGIATTAIGIGTLWALLAEDSGRHFVRLDRCVRRLIELPKLRRVEASTEADFEQGCRWLGLLGFDDEGIMRKYGLDGKDHRRYARTV